MLSPWTALALFLAITTLIVHLDTLKAWARRLRPTEEERYPGPVPLATFRAQNASRRARDVVLEDLVSGDPVRSRRAQRILEKLGGSLDSAVLVRLLKSQDTERAQRAAELLYRTGDETVLPHILEFLEAAGSDQDQVA